jgi:hypothetical protein
VYIQQTPQNSEEVGPLRQLDDERDDEQGEVKLPKQMTRQERDHLRYMAHQSERQAKQRDYYQSHKEQVKAKVRECERKRIVRELNQERI